MLDRSSQPIQARRLCTLVVGALLLCLLGASQQGCTRSLLSPSDERTPFDRYDAVRAQDASQYVEDKYGQRQPNLRQRLGPKDD